MLSLNQYFIHTLLFAALVIVSAPSTSAQPIKLAIVSSYHSNLFWEQQTHKGLITALSDQKLLTPQQSKRFTQSGYLQDTSIEIKKWWLDSKRKNNISEIQSTAIQIIKDLQSFKPDLIITGDDNATNFIGNHYVDSPTPVVFYGLNGNPMKYGLIDSPEQPGRNITGVYQGDHLKESIEFLKALLPEIQTFAVLADDSPTSRAQIKKINRLAKNQELPISLVDITSTNSFELWKQKAKSMSKLADAFLVLNHNTLHDKRLRPIDNLYAGSWYLKNIRIPEVTPQEQFIVEGMLAGVNDSGYQQGYEAGLIVARILQGDTPATIKVTSPPRGDFVANKKRARMLGILSSIRNNSHIENWVNASHAMDRYP